MGIEPTGIDYSAGFADIGVVGGDDATGSTGDVEVTGTKLSATEGGTGESVTVTVSVENAEGRAVARTLRLRADGVPIDRRTVCVSPDTTGTYRLSGAPSRAGGFGDRQRGRRRDARGTRADGRRGDDGDDRIRRPR